MPWLESSSEAARGLLEFVDAISDGMLQVDVTTLDRLVFTVSNDGASIWDDYNRRDLSDYGAIHMRSIDKNIITLDYAGAVQAYALARNVKVIDCDGGYISGKLSQMIIFHLAGLPVPSTIASYSNPLLLDRAIADMPMPFIVKANNAMMGSDNYKVESVDALTDVLSDSEQRFVVQEFVPNDGDYRVLFVGDYDKPLIFRRLSNGESHLNNTSKGARAEICDLSEFDKGVLSLCVRAAKSVGRSVTGVDIMQDVRDGSWVLLEANINPALSMGAYPEEKRDMYRAMISAILEGES